ncbi:DUF4332 domain-containing protein [Ancylothrix sp. C2]|uniref:DUF4332 domain-containing protein n=1 Tax=Ancylothrix sp. D3o TaxID=2953691 RepID=UPI0021BAD6CC|nr:DUF4332 domain-containing protein [Ancylothrix sp. D3o]MCT7949394.1 DUF4332 domain-containing protein [Ancylothrix sp. D3o]
MATNQKTYRKSIQNCDWPLDQLPGLSEQDRKQLSTAGITNTGQLLKKADTANQRQALANYLQIQIQYVNKWVALADLARLPAVGCDYCGLLLHAGVGSVSQLSQMPTHRLYQQVLRLQVATMQRRDLCPSVEIVQQWIQQAQTLETKHI